VPSFLPVTGFHPLFLAFIIFLGRILSAASINSFSVFVIAGASTIPANSASVNSDAGLGIDLSSLGAVATVSGTTSGTVSLTIFKELR